MSSEGTAGTSIAETVAALEASPPVKEKVEAPDRATEDTEHEITEAVPTVEGDAGPEGVTDVETAEEEGDTEADPAVQPPLSPPQFWDDEDKAAFVNLSRAEQERLLKYSKVADKATAAKIEQATLAQRKADAEASKFGQYTAGLDKLASQVKEAFKSKWPDDIDWNRVADERGTDEAFRLKTQYEEDKKLTERLETAQREAESASTERFIAERLQRFATVVPDLVDPKLGPQRQLDLVKYLSEQGRIHPDIIIRKATAEELSIGYKAMLWDQAQGKATSLANKKNPPPPTSKTSVRATAPVSRGSQETARVRSLEGAFAQNPSIKNLTALLEAKG